MLCRRLQEINKSIISKTTRHCNFFAEKKKLLSYFFQTGSILCTFAVLCPWFSAGIDLNLNFLFYFFILFYFIFLYIKMVEVMADKFIVIGTYITQQGQPQEFTIPFSY